VKIADYIIIEDTHKSMVETVNKRIRDGYRPYGSPLHVSSSNYGDEEYYAQAMVLEA